MRDRQPMPLGPKLTELPKSMLPARAAVDGGAYPFFCSSSEPRTISQWIADGEAVVMGTGGVASVNFGRGKFAYSTDCWAVRSRSDALRTDYLYRVLQHRLPQIDYAGFEGSGLRHLRKDYVRGLEINAPDPAVQRRIADVLSTVDEAIEQTEALIAKTRQIKAGLMHDLFTRGVLPNGQLRPPREQAPELYQPSPLGWIPREWRAATVGDYGDVFNGTTPSRAIRSYWGGTVPWISSSKVNEYKVASASEYVTDSAVSATSLRVAPAGSVVVAMVGQGRTRGMSARLLIDTTINQNVAAVVPNADCSGTYLHLLLHSQYEALRSAGRGSNRDALNTQLVRKFRVVMPSYREQLRSSEIIEAAEAVEEGEFRKLGEMRDASLGLMHDLLTSRVRIPTAVTAESPAAAAQA